LIDLVIEGGIDSILLSFPDYRKGLKRFADHVMPLLREALDVSP
jgi:alkanesulfonate monooxygenase SsuD/methylene tetrahydromethanopterin reductase-like flavin-dependent oxidoreductase (luciferase family)